MTAGTAATRKSGKGAGPRSAGSGRAGARGAKTGGASPASDPLRPAAGKPLVLTAVAAACASAGCGLAVVTLLVLVGWIGAPHIGLGLAGVLRTAGTLWLVGHHVGVTVRSAGRIGMLPLGLVLLPGVLLWRAGHWTVRRTGATRLRQVAGAALALASPYALLAGAVSIASRSALASASVPQAIACSFLLALVAGCLGGARALAPWRDLAGLLPERARSLLLGLTGALAVLTAAGALLAAAALGLHIREFDTLQNGLAPGAIGAALLLLLQIGYAPNAVIWAISFALGPGFAVGAGTVVAPTGAALGQLPAFPMLAALPPGVHSALPPWLSAAVLALPYLAGGIAGVIVARTAPTPALEAAPLWGLACGGLTGVTLGVLAAFAGGPLGDGRLAAVGPSPWQVTLVAALETGVAAAITAGLSNWLRVRSPRNAAAVRAAADATAKPAGDSRASGRRVPWVSALVGGSGPAHERDPRARPSDTLDDDLAGHRIFVNRWAGDDEPAQ